MSVDISGVDKVKLVKALWRRQKALGFLSWSGNLPSDEEAAQAVLRYIDYFGGKAIKTDISGDTVDPWLYDRDAGQGAFAEVVASLRREA